MKRIRQIFIHRQWSQPLVYICLGHNFIYTSTDFIYPPGVGGRSGF